MHNSFRVCGFWHVDSLFNARPSSVCTPSELSLDSAFNYAQIGDKVALGGFSNRVGEMP